MPKWRWTFDTVVVARWHAGAGDGAAGHVAAAVVDGAGVAGGGRHQYMGSSFAGETGKGEPVVVVASFVVVVMRQDQKMEGIRGSPCSPRS